MSLVQLKQVSKNYQMGELSIQGLKNIELETDKQSFVSFVGPLGSDETEYGSK